MYAIWERPEATPNTTRLNGLFNLTYRTDSDFWSPYGRYEQLSPEEMKMKEIATTKYYTCKQNMKWLPGWSANCGPQLRISFVHELKLNTSKLMCLEVVLSSFLLIITIAISSNLIGALTALFFNNHCVWL